MRSGLPTFGCSAHWAPMPKSKPRSPASASSSIKCNYGCWTLSHASVRQHFPRRLTLVRQALWEVSDGYLINLQLWKIEHPDDLLPALRLWYRTALRLCRGKATATPRRRETLFRAAFHT